MKNDAVTAENNHSSILKIQLKTKNRRGHVIVGAEQTGDLSFARLFHPFNVPRRARKNSCMSARHSTSNTPAAISIR